VSVPGPIQASEWSIPGVGTLGPEARLDTSAPDQGFAGALERALAGLDASQQRASEQAAALAAGEAQDPTAVVLAVERAQLAMQLANQVRNKAVEAYQEIFRTQV